MEPRSNNSSAPKIKPMNSSPNSTQTARLYDLSRLITTILDEARKLEHHALQMANFYDPDYKPNIMVLSLSLAGDSPVKLHWKAQPLNQTTNDAGQSPLRSRRNTPAALRFQKLSWSRRRATKTGICRNRNIRDRLSPFGSYASTPKVVIQDCCEIWARLSRRWKVGFRRCSPEPQPVSVLVFAADPHRSYHQSGCTSARQFNGANLHHNFLLHLNSIAS